MQKARRVFDSSLIVNPKRHADVGGAQEARLFPYYAGYSAAFAANVLASLGLHSDSCILDPWNGSGTTTKTARRLGYRAIGCDLNPVMVLVAKAEVLSPLEVGSLVPLAKTILETAHKRYKTVTEDDPLCTWFMPPGASFIRAIETEINRALVCHEKYQPLQNDKVLSAVSSIGAFFYVSVFRIIRRLLSDFVASNPTWTKNPTKPHLRKRPEKEKIAALFLAEVESLAARVAVHGFTVLDERRACSISLGNAENLYLPNGSIDVVITSPPYCTRIDYAMATAVELAVLRMDKSNFDFLRRNLMGTSTVSKETIEKEKVWGKECNRFLDKLYSHSSKASKTYYFKNHVQYFHSLYKSVGEIARVLKQKGKCVVVVQDSYYKDVHNDVPKILIEMASQHCLSMARRVDFPTSRSMVGMNKKAQSYVSGRTTNESVLCFLRS